MIKKTVSLFVATIILAACSQHTDVKRACIAVQVVRNSKLVTVDSCFTASTSDSLDQKVSAARRNLQDQQQAFETRMLFIIVDTLQKEPKDYIYALVVSEAGTISNDVILTKEALVVKERSAAFGQGNIHVRKLRAGETTKGMVEDFFKHNLRINYRTVSSQEAAHKITIE